MSRARAWWPPVVAAAALSLLPTWALGAKPRLQGKVNLNTATAEQLTLLPGVGPVTAARIVEHRKQHRFERTWEITKVRGIGPKLFRKMERHLSVEGPSDLRRDDPPRPKRKTQRKRRAQGDRRAELRGPKIIDFRNAGSPRAQGGRGAPPSLDEPAAGQ